MLTETILSKMKSNKKYVTDANLHTGDSRVNKRKRAQRKAIKEAIITKQQSVILEVEQLLIGLEGMLINKPAKPPANGGYDTDTLINDIGTLETQIDELINEINQISNQNDDQVIVGQGPDTKSINMWQIIKISVILILLILLIAFIWKLLTPKIITHAYVPEETFNNLYGSENYTELY